MSTGAVAVYLADGFNATEVVGVVEVLGLVPGLQVVTVADRPGPVSSDGRTVTMTAEAGIDDVETAEVLFVPGCRFVPLLEDERLLGWIRGIDAGSRFTAAMCVGRALLGAAGLLRGRRVAFQPVPLPDDGTVPVEHRLVVDGKYVTGANAVSSFDLGRYLAAQYLSAEEARAVQFLVEYDVDSWGPPFPERPLHQPDVTLQALFPRLMDGGIRPQIMADLMPADGVTAAGAPSALRLEH